MKKVFIFLVFGTFLYSQSKKDVKLFIYNQNFAVCNEVREMEIPQGKNELIFTDIPKFIEPSSVQFSVLSPATKFYVLEQSFNYDIYTSEKVFTKNIGEKVSIITKDGQLYSGILLFYESGNIGIETKDKIIVVNKENLREVSFAKTGMFTYKPQLKFLVQNEKKDIYKILLKYTTSNINWKADYIGEFNEGKSILNLNGFITVNNKCGVDYENAEIELIAGEVKKLMGYELANQRALGAVDALKAEKQIVSFEEQPIFEYHRYTLKGKTDIKDGEIKQINFLNKENIKVEKKYTYDGAITRYYHYDNWRNLQYNEKVEVLIEFKNEGEILPAGKIKIFKDEKEGSIFIGENKITHTPIGDKVKLSLGNAFDIKGERKIISHERISQQVYKDTYEIKIKNFKKEDVVVEVIEHLYGTWEITDKSQDYEKIDAYTIKFPVKVKSNGEEIVKYTVITRF
ncbi:MAG: hypothetical protein NZ891_06200 [bacterium]|nr:hypothetical protein [bacterium]MDW8164315.1 hypothetical protein [Candidatus Omnitrophota bacterium]